MKLIVNADDFGLTRGVNLGIAEACARGIVRSTTVMAGMPAITHAAKLARQNPSLKTGVHLRLTAGAPMAEGVPSLLGDDNRLQSQGLFWENQRMDPEEIEKELRAQIESVLELGFELTHLDSHHHCHAHDQVSPVTEKLAEDYGVPLRPCLKPANYNNQTLTFSDAFYGEALTIGSFLNIVKKHLNQTDVLEIMTHPAKPDDELSHCSSYIQQRADELKILTAPQLKDELEALGVIITDYTTMEHHTN